MKKHTELKSGQVWDPLPHMPPNQSPFVIDKVEVNADGKEVVTGHPEGYEAMVQTRSRTTILRHYRERGVNEDAPRLSRVRRRRSRELIYAHDILVGQVWTPISRYNNQSQSPVVVLDKSTMSVVVRSIEPPVRRRPMMISTLRGKYEFAADSIEVFQRMTASPPASIEDNESVVHPVPEQLEAAIERFADRLADAIHDAMQGGFTMLHQKQTRTTKDAIQQAMKPYDKALRSLID